jgi:hypothetical protein
VADVLDRLKTALADRYAIERELGAGGMATVYLAHDTKLGRPVALKVLKPELAAALGPERFLREIEIAAKLTHPNILGLYDCGTATTSESTASGQRLTANLLYYTMPFVEGESLRGRLEREKQLPLDDALQITKEVADALGYAHSLGLVHRDIKPENILFQAGHALVADFGIARAVSAAGDSARLTETGLAIGTPAYMSPEQAAGNPDLDGRSDLYSLGCVLYEMLTGETPYTGPSAQAILAKKLSEPVGRVSVVRETVPAGVEAALGKALARTPADRYRTAAEFAGALAHPEAVVVTPVGVAARRRAVWRRIAAAAAVVVVAAAAAGVFIVRTRARGPSLDSNLIAVLPFRVTSRDTVLQELGEQLPDLLWARLTGEFGPRTTDPAYVFKQWQAKRGTAETPVPEAGQLEIAQAVGAGRLLVGSVTGTVARVSLTGSLVDVRSGATRVVPRSVEGPYDSFPALVDRLTNLVLAEDYGDAVHRLPELAGHPTAAVQAYLRGVLEYRRSPLTNETVRYIQSWFARALELDSTLVLAALAKYGAGENDEAAAEYAWAHQSALSPRDRALLHALAGTRFGAHRSFAERLASFDSVVQLAPQWALAAFEQSHNLQHWGGALWELAEWRERARVASRRAATLDPDSPAPIGQLFDLALVEGDTAEARRQSMALTRLATGISRWSEAWATRLRLALAVADTALTDRLWAEGRDSLAAHPDNADAFLYPLHGGLVVDGRGLRELDRFMALAGTATPTWEAFRWVLARERGRYREWRSLQDARLQQYPYDRAPQHVNFVLFLGDPEDSSVQAAAAYLDQVASGAAQVTDSTDPPWRHVVVRAASGCESALWHLAHGETSGARQVLHYLTHEMPAVRVGQWGSPFRASVCAALIGALLAERDGGDVHAAVLQLDSIARPFPNEATVFPSPAMTGMVVAGLLARHGEPARALAALRRGCPWESWRTNWDRGLIVDCLRQEGRLAALAGDRAGAVRAYEHYLALREDPEPPWRAQRDSVVAELSALTGGR